MSSKISSNLPTVFRQGSLVLAGMLAAALAAQAQTTAISVLDDFEAGSNQNKFLGYSFFYTDVADGGTSKVNSSSPGTKPSESLVDPAKSFDAGYGGSVKSLKMDFTYGANRPKSCGGTCAYGQMVGFGTQFVPGTDNPDGSATTKTLDITGATALTFYAKATVAMKMRVEITTTGVKDFAFHRGEVTLGTDWAKQTVMLATGLGGINQPIWTQAPVTFDPTTVQKLQFSISADDNANLTAGTVWLDSLVVVGYKWVPPTACLPCVGPGPATGALLSDLEPIVAPPRAANQNAVGGFWYAYNDVGTRTVASQSEYSEIFEGADADPTNLKSPLIKILPGKGANTSQGAYIRFVLGPSYTDKSNLVMPFVGVGTKTSDALETTAMDVTGSSAIAFDYWTDAASTFPYLLLEVKTNQTNLGTNPDAVHSVLLPATAGAWKTATVAWNKFSLPDWQEVPDKTVAVKLAGITKIQWAVKDAPKTSGAFAIDNVKFPGLTTIGTPIRNVNRSARGLRMHQAAGRLDVDFDLPAGVSTARVSLVDMTGAVVKSQNLSGMGQQIASLDTRGLRSGLYSLQVRHGDVVRGLAVTLLK